LVDVAAIEEAGFRKPALHEQRIKREAGFPPRRAGRKPALVSCDLE